VGMISLYQHTSTVVSEGVEIFKPFRNKGLDRLYNEVRHLEK